MIEHLGEEPCDCGARARAYLEKQGKVWPQCRMGECSRVFAEAWGYPECQEKCFFEGDFRGLKET